MRLLTNQLLRLSAHSRKENTTANQIKAVLTILDAFGNAKTLMNPNASRHGRLVELHFSSAKGRITNAKFLAYNLDKSRLGRLTHEERTFHVFYQFLAGATPNERDHFNLEDPSDYALLASSGCYRLPSGPFSDDSIALGELRAALASLGFKPKHLQSIFTILSVILLMSNLEFGFVSGETGACATSDSAAYVENRPVLEQVARLLGVDVDADVNGGGLEAVLTTRTRYVRKELVSVILDKEGAEKQRERCMRDLYAILFAYLVETCNHRLAPSAAAKIGETIPLVMLDQPGFQTRGPTGTMSVSLSSMPFVTTASGANSFEELTINFAEEVVSSFVNQQVFGAAGLNNVLKEDCLASGMKVPEELGGEELLGAGEACAELLTGGSVLGGGWASTKKIGGLVGIVSRASAAWKTKGGEEISREDEMSKELEEKYGSSGPSSVVHIERPTVSSPHSSHSHSLNSRSTMSFTITHFSGPVTYTAASFVEKDADLMDASFVSLLRSSRDSFISKLVSGPSLAAERHGRDAGIIVQAQVQSRPLRSVGAIFDQAVYTAGSLPAAIKARYPTATDEEIEAKARAVMAELEERGVVAGRGRGGLDPARTYGVLAQVGWTMSEVVSILQGVVCPVKLLDLKCMQGATAGQNPFELPDFSSGFDEAAAEGAGGGAVGIPSPGTRIFVLNHIRPNDSASPNSFDKRRVKAQIKSLGVAELVKRFSSSPAAVSPFQGDDGVPVPTGLRGDWTVAMDAHAFCERYVGRMRGTDGERLRQCARAEGWRDGVDVIYMPVKAKGLDSVSLARGGDGYEAIEGGAPPVRGRGRKPSMSGTLGRESEDNMRGAAGGETTGRVWLTYDAWKGVEDGVRAMEKAGGAMSAAGGTTVDGHGGTYEGDYGDADDATTDWGHSANHASNMLTIPGGGVGYGGAAADESNDNLLLPRTAADGSKYLDPNGGGYAAGGLKSPGQGNFGGELTPPYPPSPSFGGDSKEDMSRVSAGGGGGPGNGDGGMIVKEAGAAGQAVEEVPTSRTRRWWLWIVWGTTWWMPSFMLRIIGRMKRPDVRLAWREKYTIFWLILLLNGIVIFYIVEFGRLLCPDYDKAWSLNEVNQHQGDNDYWVAVQGTVYDLTKFIGGDHSDIANIVSNSPDNLEQLAGQDLTNYFPPPLNLACYPLVDNEQLFLTHKNWSVVVPTAMHISGALQSQRSGLQQPTWYGDIFKKTMLEYRKGPLVWEAKDILAEARDDNIKR